MLKTKSITATADYRTQFWNAMKGGKDYPNTLISGKDDSSGAFILPDDFQSRLDGMVKDIGIFRNHANVITAYNGPSHILATDCEDVAMFVPENGEIPFQDGMDNFTPLQIDGHKLAVGVKLDSAFVHDASFNMEDCLAARLACNFAKAEDNGFINGQGVYEPTGILDEDNGAERAIYTGTITYDDVISLFYALETDYRSNAIWMMNSETALKLRTMKDDDGNYLWNTSNDTILGKPVIISEYMPSEESGTMPIVFGDFRYYWIVRRSPFSITVLKELFIAHEQIGYLAYEYLDGKLVRRKAVQGICVNTSGA